MGNPILEINPNTRLDSQKIASFFLYGFQSDFGKSAFPDRKIAGLDWGETTGIPSWLTTNVTS